MKQRKFKSPTSAEKFAKAFGLKVHKGKKTTLADGKTKANWYSFTKGKGKKKK
jgi:hypothetical protein